MKILKYGEGYPKTAICDNCKSELEYDADDLQIHASTRLVGYGKIQEQRMSQLICPVCNYIIQFEPDIMCEYEITPPAPVVTVPAEPPKKKKWWQR